MRRHRVMGRLGTALWMVLAAGGFAGSVASETHGAPSHGAPPRSTVQAAPPAAAHAPAPAPATVAAPAPAPAVDSTPAPAATHAPAAAAHAPAPAAMPPEEVFAALLAGNQRTQSDETRSPNCSIERRTEIAKGQHPLAVVVTCSDSRVPPERIFDQGYGDLFVVRSAGNVVDDVGLGSIEYAVDHLGARLIFVLGHTKCGAVGAAVQGGPTPGHLPAIMRAIAPAVEKEKDKPGDLAFNAMLGNVRQVVLKIAKSTPQIKDMIEAGTVRIVGGYYDLDTSAVNVTFRPVL